MRYGMLAGLVMLGLGSVSSAQELRTTFGLLTCTLDKNLECGFKPAGTGPEEKYVGSIRRADQELGSGKLVFVWTVVGPKNAKMSPGMLTQRFVKRKGPSDQPSILVGEKNPEVMLQLETSNGAESGSSVIEIELKLTGTPA